MIQLPANGSANGHSRAYAKSLTSPHPLGGYLPALYQDDEFAQRWTAGLDAVLAPIFNSIDNFEAYLDPRLAPLDFLDWLATWMGLVADETWPVERRRAFVSQASVLYRMRGTPRGLAAHVQIFSGGQVEILERGGAAWSTTAGAKLPGSPGFDLIVRVRLDDPASVDASRLDAIVAAAKPAHLTHRVELGAPAPPRGKPGPPPEPEGPPPSERPTDDPAEPQENRSDG
jgi:phage tail-like protein